MRKSSIDESSEGREHLRLAYPQLTSFFDLIGPLQYPNGPNISLLDAVARVINSQMLSTHAARAIMTRLQDTVRESGSDLIAELSDDQLRNCGWSRNKVKTLRLFVDAYYEQPSQFDKWPELPFDELERQVKSCWGISTWTAEMLAIFYFNNRDVFPKFDLAVNRAVEGLAEVHETLDPDLAKPHRTLLAMYMWASYRTDYWDSIKSNL